MRENNELTFGLTELTINKINSILRKYSEVEKALLYGSRAKGNYKNGSDIDLALFGENLTLSILFGIKNDLDDLLLPYKMDLSIFHNIENPDLIDHIQRVGKIFYSKK